MNPIITKTLIKFDCIYFQASDPGAFYIMEPVFEVMQNLGIKCYWIFEGWCAKAKKEKIGFINGDAFMAEVASKDFTKSCILQGTQVDYKREHEWLEFSRRHNLYSIVFIDYWKNYLNNFYDQNNGKLYLPNKIWVIDKLAYEEAKQELATVVDVDENVIIEQVGHPGIEKTKNEISKLNDDQLLQLKSKYQAGDKQITLLILDPLNMDSIAELAGFDEFDVLKYFFENFNLTNSKILIRLHPRHNIDDVEPIVSIEADKASIDYGFVHNECINNLLAISDNVTGTASTVLLTAYKLGIPVCALVPHCNDEFLNLIPTLIRPFIYR